MKTLLLLALIPMPALAGNNCDSPLYEERAAELMQIMRADQEDRKTVPQLSAEVSQRDKLRRMRVGEIFAEGCFKTAQDYTSAALAFSHGNVPDHFFQAFIWSKRAVEQGDITQKRMMAIGLDKYLVNTGKKQLFATHGTKDNNDEPCWCLSQVEKTFSDEKRMEYFGRNRDEALMWIDELNKGLGCPPPAECKTELKPTPLGSVPGFW